MNVIQIFSPRWHDRMVLIADWKIGNENKVMISHSSFPEPLYITGAKARTYPIQLMKTKNGSMAKMRVVPLNDLEPVPEAQHGS